MTSVLPTLRGNIFHGMFFILDVTMRNIQVMHCVDFERRRHSGFLTIKDVGGKSQYVVNARALVGIPFQLSYPNRTQSLTITRPVLRQHCVPLQRVEHDSLRSVRHSEDRLYPDKSISNCDLDVRCAINNCPTSEIAVSSRTLRKRSFGPPPSRSEPFMREPK
jgi:hypothetical protein